jgi:hypothetical protein
MKKVISSLLAIVIVGAAPGLAPYAAAAEAARGSAPRPVEVLALPVVQTIPAALPGIEGIPSAPDAARSAPAGPVLLFQSRATAAPHRPSGCPIRPWPPALLSPDPSPP